MSKADQWVTIALCACILTYGIVLIIGLTTHRFPFLSTLVNLITGLSILLYWVQKQLRIEYHIFEMREWAALLFEAIVVGISIYAIVTKQWTTGLRIFAYIFFGIHLFVLLAMVIFAMTFRMKRLF
jgi:hypothetical protein